MSDVQFGERRRAAVGDYVLYLVGVVGLAFAITSVWLGMRAVMDLGGYCASGGPYQINVECPDGVSLIMFLAFPLGFISAGLMVWKGAQIGGGLAELVGLAWPALFLSLGFNFLQFAFAPPDGSGEIVWGWLIPGVLFMLMGGFPLLGFLGTRDHTTVMPGVGARPTPKSYAELARAMRELARLRAAKRSYRSAAVLLSGARAAAPLGGSPPSGPPTSGPPTSLVEGLERLAALHTARALTEAEYEDAKRALITAAARGELGGRA